MGDIAVKTYAPIPLALHTRDYLATIAASRYGTGPDWFRDLPAWRSCTPKRYRETIRELWDWCPAIPDADNPVWASYRAFARELRLQWNILLVAGLQVEFTDDDPTHTTSDGKLDPGAFFEDYRRTGVLRIFRSQEGDHPITAPTNPREYWPGGDTPLVHVWHNGRAENLNSVFRAVHDFLGHMASGVGFGWDGETTAYFSQASTFSEDARNALFCETVAQQCYFYEHGRQFADVQKVIAYSPGFHRAPVAFR
jgi:hypothetical protein